MERRKAPHWAIACADAIASERGDKECYVCASGSTPLSPPTLSQFREVVTVDFVARALAAKGKRARFLFSWDEYDVFRRVPPGAPPELAASLRKPLAAVPDPEGRYESWARRNERAFEDALPETGIAPEFIRQAGRFAALAYAPGIAMALREHATIRGILNEFRSDKLAPDWLPVSVYCSNCLRDTTRVLEWDGDAAIGYECDSCGRRERVDLRCSPLVKPYWRIDWPMRWTYEEIDFEPARKDHHAHGGSFDTAKAIVKAVYGREPPVSFIYSSVAIRSPEGQLVPGDRVSLAEALSLYTPDVLRYAFARAKPTTEVVIPFGSEIVGLYEEYDRAERAYYGLEPCADPDEAEKERWLYLLAQPEAPSPRMPCQVPFRLLCDIVQIAGMDEAKALASLPRVPEDRVPALKRRIARVKAWMSGFAPADLRFSPRDIRAPGEATGGACPMPDAADRAGLAALAKAIEACSWDERSIAVAIAESAEASGVEARALRKAAYRAAIGKEHGPKLPFMIIAFGRERFVALLARAAGEARP